MHYALIFVLLLTFILGLGRLARAISVPYPILFVIGGVAVGFIPDLPNLHLDPGVVFFIFLPPLLYVQAVQTSWRDFRFYLRSIMLLAIGLVLVTTVAVAYTAHWLIPDFPLSAGFVLGAIISPPDAIAASTIARRLGLPRRVLTVLEGESLVNDATSLVVFKIALAAGAMATMPAIDDLFIPVQFIYVPAGGIAIGLLIGWLTLWLGRRGMNDDPQMALTTSLAIPFLSYLAADLLNMSGVMAVVSTGLYLGRKAPEVVGASATRLQSQAFWDTVVYILNGMIFILIGLQLPGIVHSMRQYWWPQPFYYAVIINALCIVVRIAWVFPGAYLPRLISRRIRAHEDFPDWRQVFIVSWSGIRGVVSLAAALALNGDSLFPRSHLVQFLAFSVILTTLVFQGLTLPILIRILDLKDDGIPQREEQDARRHISAAVLTRIDHARESREYPPTAIDRLEQFYRERAWSLQSESLDLPEWHDQRQHLVGLMRLHRSLLAAQREALLELRRQRLIGDDVVHKIEHELDFDESRLGP